MSKLEVGDVVMTKWDDADKPLCAVIEKAYRGHRGMKYEVSMAEDGTSEIITADQIVGREVRT